MASTDNPAATKSGRKHATAHTGRKAVPLGASEAGRLPRTAPGAETRPARRTTKCGREVRGRILQAALDCFSAFGFEGTSTRAVAKRADVSHTLVLYHFHSKDQLWIAAMDTALSTYSSAIYEQLDRAKQDTAAEALRAFIDRFTRMSAEHPKLHRILTMESNQETERLEWVIDHYLREHFERIMQLIRDGQREGAVRQCDPARLYYMIIGASGTPFTLPTEYKALTGRNVYSQTEVLRNIAFLYELVFIDAP